jgi:hypothetical protein
MCPALFRATVIKNYKSLPLNVLIKIVIKQLFTVSVLPFLLVSIEIGERTCVDFNFSGRFICFIICFLMLKYWTYDGYPIGNHYFLNSLSQTRILGSQVWFGNVYLKFHFK